MVCGAHCGVEEDVLLWLLGVLGPAVTFDSAVECTNKPFAPGFQPHRPQRLCLCYADSVDCVVHVLRNLVMCMNVVRGADGCGKL